MHCFAQHDNGRRWGWAKGREVAAVYLATVLAILGIRWSGLTAWWTTPAILIAAGIVPFLARRQSPPAILRVETICRDLGLTVCTSLAILPLTYLAIGLLTRLGIAMPFAQARPSNYAVWVLYQFLYTAVAEEVFFRGYLLSNALKVFKTAKSQHPTANIGLPGRNQHSAFCIQHLPPIVLSAACFALAHAVLQGQAAGLLTFLPGLVLGWLFVRTRTLVSPILFHGLANVFWQLAISR